MTANWTELLMRRVPGVLCILLILASCAPQSSITLSTSPTSDCLDALPDPAPVTGVFVEPDDGYDPVVREIDSAACTIDVSVYILSDDFVIDALGYAADRGVRVRIMLEEHPFGGGGGQVDVMERLELLGI